MRFGRILTVPLLTSLLTLAPAPSGAAVSVSVRISSFHRELAPYGHWVTVASYGEVWYPSDVAGDWQPYLDGEWIYTDYGWTWVSYDPFGEIPFHYGTWVWLDPYGWVWVPGAVWAPAWVTWCYSDDDVGWAPLPPSIDLRLSGYVGPPVVLPPSHYVFVPTGAFVGRRISPERLPLRRNRTILAHARKATTFAISQGVVRDPGPPVTRIERITHRRIERRPVETLKLRPTSIAAATRSRRVPVVAHRLASRGRESSAKRRGHADRQILPRPVRSPAKARGKAARRQPRRPAATGRTKGALSHPAPRHLRQGPATEKMHPNRSGRGQRAVRQPTQRLPHAARHRMAKTRSTTPVPHRESMRRHAAPRPPGAIPHAAATPSHRTMSPRPSKSGRESGKHQTHRPHPQKSQERHPR
jgi:Family of unknown function (DUF6600)